MRTAVADTSIAAYHAMRPRLGGQQNQVVGFLARNVHRDYTRSELAEATGMRLSSVCGRVAELIERRVTGVNAHPLRLAPQMEAA